MIHSHDRIPDHACGQPAAQRRAVRPAGQARGRRGLRQGRVRGRDGQGGCATSWTKQKAAGIDIGNDGEQQRVGFQTYVPARMSGFGGVSKRRRGREFEEFPELMNYLKHRFPHVSKQQNAPECQGELKYLDIAPLQQRDRPFQGRGADSGAFSETFMTAPSPGIISSTMLNAHYASHEAYLEAIAREMRNEYQAIHRPGLHPADRCARPRHGPHHALSRSHRDPSSPRRWNCMSP